MIEEDTGKFAKKLFSSSGSGQALALSSRKRVDPWWESPQNLINLLQLLRGGHEASLGLH